MSNEPNGSNTLIAFLFGVSLGAMGGLLLAPTSGRKLRRKLQKQGHRMQQRAVNTAEDLRDRGVEAAERISEMAVETKDTIKSKVARS